MEYTHLNVLMIASNSTHIKIYDLLINFLSNVYPKIKFKVVTLSQYYKQIDPSTINKLNPAIWFDLKKWQSRKDFWELSGLEKLEFTLNGYYQVKKLIRKIRPDIIILGNDTGFIEQCFITHSRPFSTTVLLQDGILNSSNYLNKGQKKGLPLSGLIKSLVGFPTNEIYGLSDVGLRMVMGNYTKFLLSESGVPPEKMKIVGQPRFEIPVIKGTPWHSDYKNPDNLKNFLWVTQPLKKYKLVDEKVTTMLDDFLLNSITGFGKGYSWTILVHPSDSPTHYDELVAELEAQGYDIKITFRQEFKEVVNNIDYIFLYTSTISLEAMIYEKPIILVNPFYEPDYFQFGKIHGMLSAHTPLDSQLIINDYEFNQDFIDEIYSSYKEILENHVGFYNGISTSIICTTIAQFLEA